MPGSIIVSVVNYNHLRYLPDCLRALQEQSLPPAEIVVLDNASTDGSQEWLRRHGKGVRLAFNPTNRGYAGGHNRIFGSSESDYVLALNCDVVLDRSFLQAAVTALETNPSAGSASGRLLLNGCDDAKPLDSTGLFPDRFRRFHDRDHGDTDQGQRSSPSLIFGPSGSAAVYRRAMLEDVAFEGQYFDESFFAYCEDADLAWRAQRLGWSSILVPTAVASHVHDDMSRARSGRRDPHAAFRQMLLIRNRHLCFLKNDEPSELARDFPFIGGYDAALAGYLAIKKPTLAVAWPASLFRNLPSVRRWRNDLFRRARRSVQLADWFDWNMERPLV